MSARDRATVRDVPDEGRFELVLDGEVVGSTAYDLRDDRVVFTHTEVDDAYEGEGLGSVLASGALDAVRARDRKTVPLCPFVAGFIDRHDDYSDLVDHQLLATIERE